MKRLMCKLFGHRCANSSLAKTDADIAEARRWLAGTDIGSLPNDWTLAEVAEARWEDICKLRDQVRDTCRRAEAAEARIAELEKALTPFAKEANTHGEQMPDRMIIDDYEGPGCKTTLTIADLRKARAALSTQSSEEGK